MDALPAEPHGYAHGPIKDKDKEKLKLMHTRMGPSWPIADRQLMVTADVKPHAG